MNWKAGYNFNNIHALGVLVNNNSAVINVNLLSENKLPNNMHDFILDFKDNYLFLKEALNIEKDFELINVEDVNILNVSDSYILHI